MNVIAIPTLVYLPQAGWEKQSRTNFLQIKYEDYFASLLTALNLFDHCERSNPLNSNW